MSKEKNREREDRKNKNYTRVIGKESTKKLNSSIPYDMGKNEKNLVKLTQFS